MTKCSLNHGIFQLFLIKSFYLILIISYLEYGFHFLQPIEQLLCLVVHRVEAGRVPLDHHVEDERLIGATVRHPSEVIGQADVLLHLPVVLGTDLFQWGAELNLVLPVS